MTDDRSFAEWLLAQGLLGKSDLRRAMEAQRGRQGRLDTEILDLRLMPEAALLEALGTYHKTRTASATDLEFASPAAIQLLTPRIASRLEVVPFRLEGRTLSVATLSPGDLLVEDEVAQQTGCLVASFVTLEIRFVEALHRHYQAPITARYAGLIRRLSGGDHGSASVEKSRPVAEAELQPAPEPPPKPPVAPKRRPRPEPEAEPELELSTEELDLFPSIRAGELDDRADDGSISGERTLSHDLFRLPPEEAPAAPPAEELGPDELLVAASLAMQHVEMRDDVADAMLGFCAPFFRRRMMLMHRQGRILGWRGEGTGVDEQAVRAISIPADEPSVFSGLLQGVEFWLGPLPTMPHNTEVVLGLGGPPPSECFIMPVRLKDKVVCFLYGDNHEGGVGGLPLAELRRLARKASLGFQVYLMKGKIRTT